MGQAGDLQNCTKKKSLETNGHLKVSQAKVIKARLDGTLNLVDGAPAHGKGIDL